MCTTPNDDDRASPLHPINSAKITQTQNITQLLLTYCILLWGTQSLESCNVPGDRKPQIEVVVCSRALHTLQSAPFPPPVHESSVFVSLEIHICVPWVVCICERGNTFLCLHESSVFVEIHFCVSMSPLYLWKYIFVFALVVCICELGNTYI